MMRKRIAVSAPSGWVRGRRTTTGTVQAVAVTTGNERRLPEARQFLLNLAFGVGA